MATMYSGRYTAEIEGGFVVFLIGMRLNRPWKVHQMHAAGPGGAVRGPRRPPGDHLLGIAVHERPVGLGQLVGQRLGPRPPTAVEEVFHGQAC